MTGTEPVRPVTWWLDRILSGKIDMKDAPEAIQSWARLSIYEGALEIIAMEWKDDRDKALAKIPQKVRPFVEAEARRLWPNRRTILRGE